MSSVPCHSHSMKSTVGRKMVLRFRKDRIQWKLVAVPCGELGLVVPCGELGLVPCVGSASELGSATALELESPVVLALGCEGHNVGQICFRRHKCSKPH